MANELKAQHATGQTLYGVLLNSAGQVWNRVAGAWQTASAAAWANYKLALSEAGGASGLYYANLPAGVDPLARVSLLVFAQPGDDPLPGDPCVAQGAVGPAPAALGSGDAVYFADVQFTRDGRSSPPRDEYTVAWFKNGVPLTAGVTSPTIEVLRRADGSSLLGPTSLTAIGGSGVLKADATDAARQSPGEAVVVVVTATIDAAPRTWRKVLGRDAA